MLARYVRQPESVLQLERAVNFRAFQMKGPVEVRVLWNCQAFWRCAVSSPNRSRGSTFHLHPRPLQVDLHLPASTLTDALPSPWLCPELAELERKLG